jgi:NAD-dependent SIR2 family protein deacetylase
VGVSIKGTPKIKGEKMPKRIFCQKCKKEINRNEVYVPQTEGKWNMAKLCRECFEKVLNDHWNGNGEVKGSRK